MVSDVRVRGVCAYWCVHCTDTDDVNEHTISAFNLLIETKTTN